MAPALVYRVEHFEDRQGPWCHDIGRKLAAISMPTPWNDGVGSEATVWLGARIHGATLDRLLYWFTEEDRQLLRSEGFVLARYVVPPSKLAIGYEQVLFSPNFAERVGEERLP